MMTRDEDQLAKMDVLLAGSAPVATRLQQAMAFLQEHRTDYHWVGIYALDGDTLVLGPYCGPATDHLRIPVGRGVCGTAVAENRNQVVDDVRELTNYLACNLDTRSEIVVLIRDAAGQILGQIDVDGTRVRQFDAAEERFLAQVAERLAPLLNGKSA